MSHRQRVRVDALPRLCAAVLLAGLIGAASSSAAASLPRIAVHGNRLFAGTRPWRAWGFNWGIGSEEPVLAYFDDPGQPTLSVLLAQLRTARALGANSMRIYLQLGQAIHRHEDARANLAGTAAVAGTRGAVPHLP